MHRAEPLFVALTADVDADANRPAPGRPDAVSPCGEAEFDACAEGTRALVEVLTALSLPAAFFWEGRALEWFSGHAAPLLASILRNPLVENGCHGYAHEDFAGCGSGLRLDASEALARLERAGAAFRSVFGRAPEGFRAPYCRLTDELVAALAELGYLYDSSHTREPSPDRPLTPYRLPGTGVWELALCRARDRDGRPVSSYLWQLFEGNRDVVDYLDLLPAAKRECGGGLLLFALHPWHLVVSADGEPLNRRGPEAPETRLRQLLQAATETDGIRFTTPGEYLARDSFGERRV